MFDKSSKTKHVFINGGHWIDIAKYIIIDKTSFKFAGIKCPRCSFQFGETREGVSCECPNCGLISCNVGDGTLYIVESINRIKEHNKEVAARTVRESDNQEAKACAYKMFGEMIHKKVEQLKTWKTHTAVN